MPSKFKNIGLITLGLVVGVFVSFQYASLSHKMTGNVMPSDKLREFSDVFNIIKSDYVEAVDDEKLLNEAMSGMVASLDPHSEYLDKEAFQELREGTEGKFVGLGLEVDMEDDYVKVVAPIEDSPAYRAGILSGDLIVQLDGVSVKGLSIDESVKRMRGEPNTQVTLGIKREHIQKFLQFTLTRQMIVQQSVKGKIVEPGYAWLRVSQFQEPTLVDLSKKIKALYAKEPNLKGLVLDLRNNPGGILHGAIGVSSVFLPKNVPVVSTNGQMEDSKEVYYAKREYYESNFETDPLETLPSLIKNVPMVVLMNAGSASASEIVAGALQDYKRAVILGTRSFGKGSVQTIRQITPDTGIKITTSRYFTPNGRSIQAQGIVPDLNVEETLALTMNGDSASRYSPREADLNGHLTSVQEQMQNKNAKGKVSQNEKALSRFEEMQAQPLQEKSVKYIPLEYGGKIDFQLEQAINYLKGLPVKTLVLAPTEASKKESEAKK
jgi:carboxyl-terminal processing protease